MTTQQANNPAPGFTQHANHKIELVPEQSVTIKTGDEIAAKSTAAICMREGNYPSVLYIPRQDILAKISKSEKTSYCPFKGDASYWNIEIGGKVITDAAWSYDNPYDEMRNIKDHLAFYSDKVAISQP